MASPAKPGTRTGRTAIWSAPPTKLSLFAIMAVIIAGGIYGIMLIRFEHTSPKG